MSEWRRGKDGELREYATFGSVTLDVTNDWPKMPEPEEVARWEAAWRERLAAEARERAA